MFYFTRLQLQILLKELQEKTGCPLNSLMEGLEDVSL